MYLHLRVHFVVGTLVVGPGHFVEAMCASQLSVCFLIQSMAAVFGQGPEKQQIASFITVTGDFVLFVELT